MTRLGPRGQNGARLVRREYGLDARVDLGCGPISANGTDPDLVADAILEDLGPVAGAAVAAALLKAARPSLRPSQWQPPILNPETERRRAQHTDYLRRLQAEVRGTTPETWAAARRGVVAT